MEHTNTESRILETPQGPVMGISEGGISRFLGVPYGIADRFQPARRPDPWTSPYPALERGARCPQAGGYGGGSWMSFLSDKSPMSEDCLRINIYAPDKPVSRPRPVMLWLHGGGFVSGSGGRVSVNGAPLAARGDVVVVTLNHRLNAFGFTFLGDIIPDHDGINVGITDIVCALEWIRDNIAAFGGDAGNVTIFGQSGGGGKVSALMAMPSAEGLFHRAVIQSASTLVKMATRERATACARLLLEELNIDDPTPEALSAPSADEVLAARIRAVKRNGGVDDFRPVVDGVNLPANPCDPTSLKRSSHVPLLIGVCEDEITFFLAAADPDFHRMDEQSARRRITHFVGLDADAGNKFYDDISAAYPDETPAEIASRAMSEHMYRRNDRLAADLRSAYPDAPVFNYLFTWKTAALDGHLKSPHTLCIPLIFGTTDTASELLGRPAEALALSEKVMDAWLAFAHNGDPNHSGLPEWPVYDATRRATMVFDDICAVVDDPLPEMRKLIEPCPAYSTDKGSGAARAAV